MTESRPSCSFELRCPLCSSPVQVETDSALCEQHEHRFRRAERIWRFLPLTREIQFRDFMIDYRAVREKEGWGSDNAAYYRALPNVRGDDPQRAIWRLRAENLKALLALQARSTGLKILDAGAGNGWLSYRLARLGHVVASLDLSDDVQDGLGAWRHYDLTLECYQAEFDRLPFREAQFDRVIFNAALHYSTSLEVSLCEAKRVLKPDGRIIVLDSPFYSNAASGKAMVEAREAEFERLLGFQRRVLNVGFLTPGTLQQAALAAGLEMDILYRAIGWGEAVRRELARRRNGREPARFPLIELHVA